MQRGRRLRRRRFILSSSKVFLVGEGMQGRIRRRRVHIERAPCVCFKKDQRYIEPPLARYFLLSCPANWIRSPRPSYIYIYIYMYKASAPDLRAFISTPQPSLVLSLSTSLALSRTHSLSLAHAHAHTHTHARAFLLPYAAQYTWRPSALITKPTQGWKCRRKCEVWSRIARALLRGAKKG